MNNNQILGLGFSHHQNNTQQYFNELINTALQNGITYFEACSFYNNYTCEQYLTNSLLKITQRDKFLLGDKLDCGVCNNQYNGNLERYFTEQLNKCNTDYFDYYFIQYVDKKYFTDKRPNELFKQQYNFLLKKKEEGKIKNLGFVFHYSPECFESCFQEFQWDCVQFALNYYKWKYGYGKTLYQIASQYHIPVIAMEPLAMGLLSKPPVREASYNFLKTLSNVKIILNGATQSKHLIQNLNELNNNEQLTSKHLAILDVFLNKITFNCNCEQCIISCPRKIDIKQLVQAFNSKDLDKYEYYKHSELFMNNYTQCYNCSICYQQCIQHINFSFFFWKAIFPLRI